ncbi:hypothetical protein BLA6860_07536 [Burkholderia lata]|nr:hypothetical protein [Burkholderia lata]VWC47692.1 hypothetical protein BLA6860_07536 [Burkholderia lata]
MNKAMLGMCGLLICGLVVTLVVVLETVPKPQAKITQATAKPVKVR